VLSTATKVESAPEVASLDAPLLQEISAKEATKESKKIVFFIFYCFILHGLYTGIITMFRSI
jgi:hypothetical protein